MEKPPIGLCPRKIWEEKRFNDVCDAIARYYNAGLDISLEWVNEYNEFVKFKKEESLMNTDIQNKKRKAEQELQEAILKITQNFYEETGKGIKCININFIDISTVSDKTKKYMYTSCEIFPVI